MQAEGLFRKEVIARQSASKYGHLLINVPYSFRLITIGCGLFILALMALVIFADFSEKFIVTGYVNSTKGIITIFPTHPGLIMKRYVSEGDKVKKGAPLFLIDSSQNTLKRDQSDSILEALQQKKRSIFREIQEKKSHLLALKPLLAQQYISRDDYQREHQALIQVINEYRMAKMALIKHQQSQSYIIRAPIDGVVSNANYQVGQATPQTLPMMKIMPLNAALIAELFIPVRHSGYLSRLSRVMIRYDAYPYERFGSYPATIQTMSPSIMTDEQEDKPIKIGQPYYKVIAHLNSPMVHFYGQQKKIQHGMTLSAVVVGAKRKLWQWMLDPIYSQYGAIFA